MNKASVFGGAAVVAALGAGVIPTKNKGEPLPAAPTSEWGGFAEVSQKRTFEWVEGTNRYECRFDYNPDATITSGNHQYHPGVALVFINGERVGTNISTHYPDNPDLCYLTGIVATARESEAK